jgi:hypothetical protein
MWKGMTAQRIIDFLDASADLKEIRNIKNAKTKNSNKLS